MSDDPIRDELRKLPDAELARLLAVAEARYFPDARKEQQPPADPWQTWLILAGRGYGKTRTGAEWLVEQALNAQASYAIAAPTYADCRDVCVEGDKSGLLAVLRRRGVSVSGSDWNRSLGELRLPNGSKIKLLSADEPDRARGWNFAGAWCDELASWRYADAFTQLRLALRVGGDPRMVVTTTPKPTRLLLELLERPSTHVTRGSTFDNAENLSPAALDELRERYEGTRIGRQELYAELLTDVPGALWERTQLDLDRVRPDEAPDMERIVVSVDPAGTATEHSDETGIIIVGRGVDSDGYVLDDRSGRFSPAEWGRRVCIAYLDHEADAIVYERNMGFDMVAHTIRTAWDALQAGEMAPRLVGVNASNGKRLRAEPIAAQYEQHKWHHVGALAELEDQMCTWVPGEGRSPDRVDGLVHAGVELLIGPLHRRGGLRSHTEPNDGLVTAAAKKLYRKEETPRSGRGMRIRY